MKSLSPTQLLIRAKKRISKESNWTKGAAARGYFGQVTTTNSCFAKSWCALGSLLVEALTPEGANSGLRARNLLAEALPERQAIYYLDTAIKALYGAYSYEEESNLIAFNDHTNTAHPDVMAVFDKAIELSEQE
jgi:hypothetical protein